MILFFATLFVYFLCQVYVSKSLSACTDAKTFAPFAVLVPLVAITLVAVYLLPVEIGGKILLAYILNKYQLG